MSKLQGGNSEHPAESTFAACDAAVSISATSAAAFSPTDHAFVASATLAAFAASSATFTTFTTFAAIYDRRRKELSSGG